MPNALAPALTDRSTVLELDSLDVYRVSLEFQGLIATLLSSAHGELRSQLDRAALSISLNVAEGVAPLPTVAVSTRSPAGAPSSARRSSTSWRAEPSSPSATYAAAEPSSCASFRC